MTGSIVKTIEQFVTSQPFVERYGGLVRIVEAKRKIGNSDSYRIIRYPITCNAATDRCSSVGYQSDIVPNSMFRSIVYFEQIGEVKPIGITGPKDAVYEFSGSLRLVCWLNLPKLGIMGCNKASEFAACFLRSGLIKSHFLQEPYNSAVVEIGLPTVVERDTKTFSKYSYPTQIFQNIGGPFDWFHMDFPFKVRLGKNCIECPVAGDEIKCIKV